VARTNTMSRGATGGRPPQAATAQKSVPAIPFTHAAHENMEFVDSISSAITARGVQFEPIDIPARGYVRHTWMRFTGTGGTTGPAAVSPDFPFCVLDSIAFFDVGGGEIFNPMSGYETYLVNKYGGYVFWADPVLHPDYSADPVGFNFALRVPFEISASDALGALSNQNSQSKYKLRLTQAADSTIYTTLPTTDPTLGADIYDELWSQPPTQTDRGVPILNKPPLLGTTQYWSIQSVTGLSSGNQQIEIERRGNQQRMYILIFRDTDGVRSDSMVPDPIRFVWDSREQFEEVPQYRRQVMFERYGTPRTALDVGVYVYDNAHDVLGHPGGMDDGHLWYRTKSSSRLEFRGNFQASGSLTILVNDVAPVAVTDQFSDTSPTGGAVIQSV
jgi:hypothetical protein